MIPVLTLHKDVLGDLASHVGVSLLLGHEHTANLLGFRVDPVDLELDLSLGYIKYLKQTVIQIRNNNVKSTMQQSFPVLFCLMW